MILIQRAVRELCISRQYNWLPHLIEACGFKKCKFNLDTDIYEFNDDQKFWQVRVHIQDVTMIIAWAYGLTVASLWVLKHG